MDFEFSADQEMLRDSVRALPRRQGADHATCAPSTTARDALGRDAVWDGLRELGVVGLLVPEEYGGAGMGMVDAAVVLEELGRAVLPGAVRVVRDRRGVAGARRGTPASTVPAARPGRRLDDRHGRALRGRRAVRVARAGDAARASTATTGDSTARRCTSPTRAAADLLLVTALDADGELGVFAVAARRRRRRRADADGRRQPQGGDGHVRRRDGAGGSAPATRRGAVARTLDRLGVAYVVDGVGAAQRALELAVEYAKERVQFDKPIGSFQAVQHLCADMLRTVELGRAAGYYACWALDDADPDEAHRAATMAQAFASDAFPQLGGTAIQVFGGIGFTWEHDIHLYYKRLLSLVGRARHRVATTSPSSPPSPSTDTTTVPRDADRPSQPDRPSPQIVIRVANVWSGAGFCHQSRSRGTPGSTAATASTR